MRKVVALFLIVAVAVLGAPLAGFAADKAAARQDKPGNVAGQITDGKASSVQLRAANGQLVGNTVPDAAGNFTFSNLAPGKYTLEITVAPGKVATMAVEVVAGQTATVTVSAAALSGALATTGGGVLGMSTALGVSVIAIGATAIGIVTYQAVKDDASPSR